jgi:hypothetical protein
MERSRFDSWTRRRFGATAAGAITVLFGLGEDESARAKRKNKRKKRKRGKPNLRCEQLRTPCNPRNDRELCCDGLSCGIVPELGTGHHCCRWRFNDCESDADCCNNLRCVGSPGFCDVVGA